jgi:hypothetical protein
MPSRNLIPEGEPAWFGTRWLPGIGHPDASWDAVHHIMDGRRKSPACGAAALKVTPQVRTCPGAPNNLWLCAKRLCATAIKCVHRMRYSLARANTDRVQAFVIAYARPPPGKRIR